MLKICTNCNQTKSEEEFPKVKKDGASKRGTQCKLCKSKANRVCRNKRSGR